MIALTIVGLLILGGVLLRAGGDSANENLRMAAPEPHLDAGTGDVQGAPLEDDSAGQNDPHLSGLSESEPPAWAGGRPPLRYALRAGEGALIARIEKLGSNRLADEYSARDDDYDFPSVEVSETGEVSMQIPDAPLPSRSSKRALNQGDGAQIKEGDLVALRYDVYRWSTGELVESHWEGGEEGIGYVIDGDNSSMLPSYLENALRGRTLGSRVQVILRQGTEDLPPTFDPLDAYVVIIDIDPPEEVHLEMFVSADEYSGP
ncbi:MAG: hypothetical protein AB8G23_11910 [Myxococcota bacterium]